VKFGGNFTIINKDVTTMAYRRFLTDKDYISLATEEHMSQIIRDNHDRLVQAEQRAEMTMREYLDQYYEIEKLLLVGKNIGEYNEAISYPAQVFFRKDEVIYKTLTSINGYKKPTSLVYWEQVIDFVDPIKIERAERYSQLKTYAVGEIVKFGTEYWECKVAHGFSSNEIHIPGCTAWQEVEVTPWEGNLELTQYAVVSYDDLFYMLNAEEDADPTLSPDQNDCFALIGDYSLDYEYAYGDDSHDYVVSDSKVFKAILNPNATAVADGVNIEVAEGNEVNIVIDDPRNANVVAHMTHIAIWYALQLISPTNISEAKRWAFEDSMTWLVNASKFKINPQLPRKHECPVGEPKVDWALATFQRSYNPNENPWLI